MRYPDAFLDLSETPNTEEKQVPKPTEPGFVSFGSTHPENLADRKSSRAFQIWFGVLNDHVWIIINRSFDPEDPVAVDYLDELNALRSKSIRAAEIAPPGEACLPWIRGPGMSISGQQTCGRVKRPAISLPYSPQFPRSWHG